MQKRQTAYKFWISDLVSAEQGMENEMRFFIVRGKQAVRVNVVGVVINKYESADKRYSAMTIDDSSAQIRMKAWEEDTKALTKAEVGDIIIAVARLHQQNGEIFLRPEIVRKLAPEWALARKAELKKMYGEPSEAKPMEVTEEIVGEKVEPSIVAREKVLTIMESAPQEGMAIDSLVSQSGLNEADIESAVQSLISEGEIYNPQPGFIKLL